jgi:transcriptional regulator with XRE-family HTH domain
MPTLKELIEKAQGNRSQNEFAMHCGLSSGTLTRYKQKERQPQPSALQKIAKHAYNNVSYDDLMIAAGYLQEKNDLSPTQQIPPTQQVSEIQYYFDLLDYGKQRILVETAKEFLRKSPTKNDKPINK